ncbi:unnamed protein product [Gongylonema pulchrum]|uniref:N-acetyltransferase domain-containing protein n=1 Tax=Gongylonema pulchrum TaxID=637853 RepID=A0A183DFG0_9BILA|nr:unnamed protein product [Gongylonema pulchrum]
MLYAVQEWPRSVAARQHSLSKSLNPKPPMSLILIDRTSDKLVGHARLCPLPTEKQACWIESVIIKSDLRGQGLGRWFMAQLEDKAEKYGFTKDYQGSIRFLLPHRPTSCRMKGSR